MLVVAAGEKSCGPLLNGSVSVALGRMILLLMLVSLFTSPVSRVELASVDNTSVEEIVKPVALNVEMFTKISVLMEVLLMFG